MKRNTFKNNTEPVKPLLTVDRSEVTEKEMAVYNHVSLKLAYQKNKIDSALESMNHDRAVRLDIKVNMAMVISILFAAVGIIVNQLIKPITNS